MKKDDLIYKDDEYHIYKKHAGEVGHFEPISMLDLIQIATEGLSQWENAGFANRGDYEKVINGICERLKRTIT